MATKITIGKKEFNLEQQELLQSELKFYPENPRIYSWLTTENPTQKEIEELLKSKDYVKELKNSISTNGGLIEPVLVVEKEGEKVVLEGNSRLAAYRILAGQDPIKWARIKCSILPSDITDAEIFLLLGQLHIIGKTDWSLFDQAGYLYRTKLSTNKTVEEIAKMIGIKESDAKKLYEVYEYMVQNKDTQASHWSYYEVLLRTNGLRGYRANNSKFEEKIVSQIKEESFQAIELRDKLGAIAKDKTKDAKKIMTRFIDGELDLNEAYELYHDTGKDDDVYKTIKRFRDKIVDEDFEKSIKKAVADGNKEIPFELKKIFKRIDALLKGLEK